MVEDSTTADEVWGGKPPRMRFLAPAIVVAFLALTLAGTYFVRLRLLEKAMTAAVEIGDNATVAEVLRKAGAKE